MPERHTKGNAGAALNDQAATEPEAGIGERGSHQLGGKLGGAAHVSGFSVTASTHLSINFR